MPKGMGYGNRPNHPRHDQMRGSGPNSYRDSKAVSPATGDKTNRHGFSRNPKQNSSFRQGDGNAFPDNPGQGLKGNAGLPGKGMRHKSHKGY